MKRQAHKLCQPKQKTIPQDLIFVDTETTQSRNKQGKIYHKLLLGVAIYARFRRDGQPNTKEVFRFNRVSEFWEFVYSKSYNKTVLYLFSHNVVFDFTVLRHITTLTEKGYTPLFIFDNAMVFIGKWRKGNHSIVILNTANWFKGSVKHWGEALELPKMKMPNYTDSKEKMYVYCERDVEIIYRLFNWYVGFLAEHKLGSWKYTIASQAFYSYRYRFMHHPIYIPDNLMEQILARHSYHGGRTEVFRVGQYNKGTFYKVDVNSMYPYVMHKYEYPTCFEREGQSISLRKLEYAIERKSVIIDCTLNTNVPYFCHSLNDRNVYPVGRFRTVLTTAEIEIAIKNKWIVQVHRYIIYRKRKIFTDYVDFFYGLKQRYSETNQPLMRSFTKLYLNSLYGKFGQRGYVDKIIGQTDTPGLQVSYGFNVSTGERYFVRQIGKQIMYSQKEGEGYNSFCAIASHVTAQARLYLYDLILIACRENCFYCDTDSIIVNQEGYENLKSLYDDSKLGFLKIEGVSDNVNIIAPKHYQFDGKWTMKGVRHTAKKLGTNHYEQETWPGLNTILKSGKEAYFNVITEKHLAPSIISGNVNSQGYVQPFRL